MQIKITMSYHDIMSIVSRKVYQYRRVLKIRDQGIHTPLVRLENGTAAEWYHSIKHLIARNCTSGHLSKRNEIFVHAKASTQMLRAPSFVIAKCWGQPSCSSEGECLCTLVPQNITPK